MTLEAFAGADSKNDLYFFPYGLDFGLLCNTNVVSLQTFLQKLKSRGLFFILSSVLKIYGTFFCPCMMLFQAEWVQFFFILTKERKKTIIAVPYFNLPSSI